VGYPRPQYVPSRGAVGIPLCWDFRTGREDEERSAASIPGASTVGQRQVRTKTGAQFRHGENLGGRRER
jgi:hypothetical protein